MHMPLLPHPRIRVPCVCRQTALQRAWWDAKGLPRALVDGYRRPQAIRWVLMRDEHGYCKWLTLPLRHVTCNTCLPLSPVAGTTD